MKLYDLIGKSDAVFNHNLIVYRSNRFHAPLLGEGRASQDPRRSGRLTANGFITPASNGP